MVFQSKNRGYIFPWFVILLEASLFNTNYKFFSQMTFYKNIREIRLMVLDAFVDTQCRQTNKHKDCKYTNIDMIFLTFYAIFWMILTINIL